MHFLFVSSFLGPSIGGLEIQIARISNWLIRKGHRVTLLTKTVCDFREIFPKELKIVVLGNRFPQLCFYQKAGKAWAEFEIERPDVIKAFDLTASWIASVLSSAIKPAPKVLFGNYFPYVIPKSRNPLKYLTYKLFLLNLSMNFNDNSILCMSEEHINEFRRHYGYHRKPNFWSLPIEDFSKDGPTRSPKWGRIVSVGRLAPMKEYNIYMIDIISSLRQKGHAVTWTVYGEGEYAEAMKDRIDELGLGAAIELKGRLDNCQFADAMQHAYVFVGMGASIIEAAMCGVPGIVALAHDTSGKTYGPLYNMRFGNVGELMDVAPRMDVEAEIERMLMLGDHAYQEEVKKTREYSIAYAMDPSMNRFLEIVAKATAPKASYVLFYWYYLHNFAERIRQKVKAIR